MPVGQADRLNNPALRDTASSTAFQHAAQLFPQSYKSRNLVVDGGQMVASERVDLVTGSLWPVLQCQQPAHGFDVETELPRMPDKGEAADVTSAIAAAFACGPKRRAHKTNLFVVPDGGYFDARLASDFTDSQGCWHFFCLLL